jgi:hypothetical protein
VDYTLRTILELREFSEKEIRSCYVVKIDEEDDDDIIDLLCEENNTLANQIELLNTNSIYSNMAVKKHD